MARAGRRSGTSTTTCRRARSRTGWASSSAVRMASARSSSSSRGCPPAASPSASASSERDRRTSRSASSHKRVVGGPVGDDDAVAQRLEVALQVGQRRAQLVRRVGDEVAPHRLLALEAGGHLVERVGQAGQLLRAFARDAGRVVAVGDPPGRPADLGQRAGEHARQHDRQHDARRRGDQDRGEDDRRDRLVVHRLGVVGRVAGLDHQAAEDLRPDDGDPDRHDRDPDTRRDQRGQRDPGGDPAADHGRAAR